MQFVHINGIVIHYKWIDTDSDQTFLFINSLGSDFRIWDEVVDKLKDHGNILLFDKPGHGLSDLLPGSKGLESYMDIAAGLLQHVSVKKCIAVGVSVGGIIAQILAHYHPEKVDTLILCDTRHKIADDVFWNNRIQKIKAEGMESIAGDIMKKWFAQRFNSLYPGQVTGYKNMLQRTSLQGYSDTCKAIRDADITEISKKIRHKTLCVVGAEDGSTTVEDVRSLHELIQGSKFEVIRDSGHLPCVDNPEVLSDLIINFINSK